MLSKGTLTFFVEGGANSRLRRRSRGEIYSEAAGFGFPFSWANELVGLSGMNLSLICLLELLLVVTGSSGLIRGGLEM